MTQYHKHHQVPHCPEDITCKACCPCVELYQSQNKILKEKYNKIVVEKEDLDKLIAKLTKNIAHFEKRKD